MKHVTVKQRNLAPLMSYVSTDMAKNPTCVCVCFLFPQLVLRFKKKKASMETYTLLQITQNRMSEVRASYAKQINLAGLR